MEGTGMPKLTQVAVDTNVLLNLSNGDEVVIDCFDTLRRRLANLQVIILPTVILELTDIAESNEHPAKMLARKALESIVGVWKFQPVNCVPVGHGIVEQIGNKIREKGLLPEAEIHDSFIISEAALYGVTLLISSDAHIKDINQPMLKLALDHCDVNCPLIASPWKIVHQFFQSTV